MQNSAGWRRQALAACALTMLAIAAPASFAQASGKTVVTDQDSGNAIALAVGDSLVIKLSGHAGTGYIWRVEGSNAPQLTLAGETTKPADRPGGPMTTIFTFSADAPGTTMVKLDYVRPWEAGKPPARTFSLKVTVAKRAP